MFALHPQLKADTFFVSALPLCDVLLMNNALFPWLILVPRVDGVSEIMDLPADAQILLMKDITLASKTLAQLCAPDKINVAALGNKVEQLHVHVIARFKADAAWPEPVWGKALKHYENATATVAAFKRLLMQ